MGKQMWAKRPCLNNPKPCSKCGMRERKIGMSWCSKCMSEYRTELKKRKAATTGS